MKVLVCHNYYQQWGGEDQLFEDEAKLLEAQGHEVIWHTVHSDSIAGRGLVRVALNTVWNRTAYNEVSALIRQQAPDVVHVVNTFPLFSPAIFHAAFRLGVPTVASIQNYRYFCAQAMCFRDGKACEDCLGKIPWRAVRHGCYRNSRAGSAVVAAMQVFHRLRETWSQKIDVICVASEFSKSKLVAAGLPEQQMIIKPNFVVDDPGMQHGADGFALFVGRLAGEKGIRTLVDAWHQLGQAKSGIPLKIIGDGPESGIVQKLLAANSDVQWIGRVANDEVYEWMGRAACLVFPSTGYESLPKTLIESMAVGTPVIGSAIGSIPEIVIEDHTGCLFDAGNAESLAAVGKKFFDKKELWPQFRADCRGQFESRFTRDINYRALISLYQEAIRRHGARCGQDAGR